MQLGQVRITSRLSCLLAPPALSVLNHLWVGGCGLGIGQDVSLPLIGRRWEARGQEVHQDVCVPLIGSEGKHSNPVVLFLKSLQNVTRSHFLGTQEWTWSEYSFLPVSN